MPRRHKRNPWAPPGYPDRPHITEEWLRSIYGYFRNSYSPDGIDRNVSHSITTWPFNCSCGEWFRTPAGLAAHLNDYTVPVVAFGVLVRTTPGHGEITLPVPPPAHHLGYLMVRSYFPDHTPRLDLIADPGEWQGFIDG